MPTLSCRDAANLAQLRKLADVPSLSLDVGDAVELAEILQFLSGWLTTDPSLEASLNRFVGIRPTGSTICGPTWTGSPSCWAAATVNHSLSPASGERCRTSRFPPPRSAA
jgi:hypothetical protein